jgi:hypothetical protein
MGWWEMKDTDDREIVMTLVSRWPHVPRLEATTSTSLTLQTSNFNVSLFHD